MKNICIVAHPDDEALWFPLHLMDVVIICFTGHPFDPTLGEMRARMKTTHPLKDKIIWLDLMESGHARNKSQAIHQQQMANLAAIVSILNKFFKDNPGGWKIWTHNAWGEYGHQDHKLVQDAVLSSTLGRTEMEMWCYDGPSRTTSNPVVMQAIDLELYLKVKGAYCEAGCWTWGKEYVPPSLQPYFKMPTHEQFRQWQINRCRWFAEPYVRLIYRLVRFIRSNYRLNKP